MKNLSVIFLLLLFISEFSMPLSAQEGNSSYALRGFPKFDERGDSSESFSSRGLVLTIESERSRYQNSKNIFLKMKITNEGYYPITFYLNKNYLKNFIIIARDDKGKSLPAKDIRYYKNSQDYKDPFFNNYTATNHDSRSITLQPGESIVRPIALDDILFLNEVEEKSRLQLQKLSISSYFYPNPEQNPQLFLASSNQFLLYLRKELSIDNPKIPAPTLQPLQVSPFETVFLTLSAEKTETWNNFFKYISLKDLIRDYPNFARAYMQSQGNQKNSVLKAFQEYLMDREEHQLLKFKVLSQEENERTATVKVKAQRNIQGFRREFSYTYYLTRSEKFWLITGVESQLLE